MLQDEGRTSLDPADGVTISSLHLRAAVTLALCFLLVLFCNVAQAKVDVEVKNSRGKFSIDSDAASVATASYRCEIKTSVGEADLTLVPEFSYRSDVGAEVNLAHSYVRIPMGIWSVYGGGKTIATSFYYQKWGKGFFAGLSKDKSEGMLNGMRGARTVTTGLVFPKLGKDKNTEIKLTYSNALAENGERRYQTWSVESEKKFSEGHILSYTISYNHRALPKEENVNYIVASAGYEHMFREGFTGKLSLEFSYNGDEIKHFQYLLRFDLKMKL